MKELQGEAKQMGHNGTEGRGTRSAAGRMGLLALAASLTLLALAPVPAGASQQHLFKEIFGTAAQPSFGPGLDLVVDHSSGNLLVAASGAQEKQRITIAATGGQFKLKYGGYTTADLPFNAKSSEVEDALSALPSIDPAPLLINGGPGDATGSSPYIITFFGSAGETDHEQIACEDGTIPLSGGSGCSASTIVDGSIASLSRWNPDGTPAAFSALATNVIDAASGPGGKPCAEEPSSCDRNEQRGFASSLSWGGANDVQVAVDESSGDIYVTLPNLRSINVFASDGRYLGQLKQFGSTKFDEPCGVVVDAAGNLYVADSGRNQIHKYVPSASPPLNTDNTANFAAEVPCALAVGAGPSAGALFVNRRSGPVSKLDLASGALKYVLDPGNQGTTVSVDPGTGHVLIARSVPEVFSYEVFDEYDASGASSATRLSTTKVRSDLRGVAANAASGEIYALSFHESALRVKLFDAPVVTLPDAVTEAATDLTPTRATLRGVVNPDGLPLTECFFEYGTTTAYGQTAPCAETPAEIGTGSSPVSVHADLSGLMERTGYNFRLVARNLNGRSDANGPPTGSSNKDLLTPATVGTQPATEITGTTVTLNGTLNPDGGAVSECSFEYGTTTAYGQTAPCAETPAEIGTGSSPVAVHAAIGGLAFNTTYHFRIHATTATAGTVSGFDRSFKTLNAVTVTTGSASAITLTTATLNGTVNPGGVAFTECAFEYVDSAHYEPLALNPYVTGQTKACAESETEIGTGSSPVPVHAEIAELQPGTTYHFRLRAVNAGVPRYGDDAGFRTLGPEVLAEWAEDVLITKAALRAEINPEGSQTTFHVEYGTTTSYGQSTPESASIGSDNAVHTVSVTLEGLQAGTTYHYRFLATNADGTAAGPDRTFSTYGTLPPKAGCPNQSLRTGPAAHLPDCRAYELVSPADKDGGEVAALPDSLGFHEARLDQGSENGERLTYSSYRAFADPSSAPFTSQYIASRWEAGWSNEAISPPQEGAAYLELGSLDSHYKAFSEDLCSGWVLQDTEPILTADAIPGYANLYRRDNCGGGYEALTTSPPSGLAHDFIPAIQGFSADGSHQVFHATGKLTEDASAVAQLYEAYGGGKVRLVCVLPGGTPSSTSCSAGTDQGGAEADHRYDSVWHAVSEDGSRIYWSNDAFDALYVRIDGEETVAVSTGTAHFWGAAADGSRAIYSEGDFDSGAAELYEFDVAAEARTPIAGEVGGVMGMSEDASRVYFASKEELGGEAQAGKPNLYLHEAGEGGGSTRFVATLAPADVDQTTQNKSPVRSEPTDRTSRVTPDGLHAAFTSSAPLTGYDNTDRGSGNADTEVYVFDAVGGKLACASCNPSGARPSGEDVLSGVSEQWMAGKIPGWEYQLHGSRALSADGQRLFFESFDALVLRDTNSKQDVYEWEAGESKESCEEAGAELYVPASGGCLSLISSGESPSDSELIDASADGRDAFFTTASSLLAEDPGLLDVYDARAGGGFAPAPPPGAPCEGEACQSPPEAPNDPTPASSAFQGAGNVTEDAGKPARCAKGKVRRRGKCVSRHRKRHRAHKRHQRRAEGNRRAHR